MKPPSTVEARVAEELRNWLSSELEQLDAPNTNQFAHHVVTILLHEDLDIEDEPLTTGDDFLHDIYSIKRGKTRDKQKKAAVQFLRSAVCCNDPVEADIQVVVDELMVRIEETKSKMNSKLSPKRASVNSFNQSTVKSDSNARDRLRLYNEAFPSLHSNNNSDSSTVPHGLELLATDNSPNVAGSRQQVDVAHRAHNVAGSRQQVDVAHRAHTFNSQEEAYACHTARRVFLSAFPDAVFPSFEATEILSFEQIGSSVSDFFTEAYSCWSFQSAFQACTLLKKFVPTMSPLKHLSQSDLRNRSLRHFSPTVIPVMKQSDLRTVHLDPSYERTLTEHPQLFRPIKARRDFDTSPRSDTDMEVDSILSSKQHRERNIQTKMVDKNHSSALVSLYSDASRNSEPYTVSVGNIHSKGGYLEDDNVSFGSVLGFLEGMDENPDQKVEAIDGEPADESLVTADVDLNEEGGIVKDMDLDMKICTVRDVDLDKVVGTVEDGDSDKIVGTVEDGDSDKIVGTVEDGDSDKIVGTVEDVDLDKIVGTVEDGDSDKIVGTVEDVELNIIVGTVEDGDSDINIGTVEDGDLDINIGTVEDGDFDINIGTVEDGDLDINIGTVEDGDLDINIGTVEDGDLDINIGTVEDGDLDINIGTVIDVDSDKIVGTVRDVDTDKEVNTVRDVDTDKEVDTAGDESLELTVPVQKDCFRICSPENGRNEECPLKQLRNITDDLCDTCSPEIDEICSFPQHHGGYWQQLADAGTMTLYPVVSSQLIYELEDKYNSAAMTGSPCREHHKSPASGVRLVPGCGSTDDSKTNADHCFHHSLPVVDCGQWQLESARIQVQYYYAVRQVANVQQEHRCCLRQASVQNPFMPSLLSSCLSHEDSQFLQRAFVNSYFFDLLEGPAHNTQDKLSGIRCSDLEHCWLSTERLKFGGLGQAHVEVVPGCTCSSWLENNCHLGDSCPFSHPRI